MSLIKSLDVQCDAPDCSLWEFGQAGGRVTAKGARAVAKASGWVVRKGRDYCPEHTTSKESTK